MYISAEQVAASGRAGVDVLHKLSQAQFAAFEQVAALNLSAGKALLAGGIKHARALLAVKGARDLMQLNAAAAEPVFDKAIIYARELNALAAQARVEMLKQSELRAVEANRAVIGILDEMAKGAPAGSGVAAAAIKSALAASNASYESYAAVARQAANASKRNGSSRAASAAKRTQRK